MVSEQKAVISEQKAVISGQLAVVSKKPQDYFFRASSATFKKIPGCPIVYWASETVLEVFQKSSLSERIETREGLTTGSNDFFLRLWYEVKLKQIGFELKNKDEAKNSRKRYFPYVKGGNFRRWAGNLAYVVNWFNDGEELKGFKDPNTGRVRSHNYNGDYAFSMGFTWSGISSGTFAVRHVPSGFMFDAKGPMGFAMELSEQHLYEAFLNSSVTNHLIKMLAPTLDFKLGHILNLPVIRDVPNRIGQISKSAVRLSFYDWNSYETFWNFTASPLLTNHKQITGNQREQNLITKLNESYGSLRFLWQEMTLEMQQLEEENNRIFIEVYGLQDELTPEVPINEITLTCNPHYRYKGNKSEEELEALLLADTMKEFLSYAVGCMFGRYSLDAPGVILANQGETLEDYFRIVKEKEVVSCQLSVISKEDGSEAATDNCKLHTDNSAAGGTDNFLPDNDNVIPILDQDWFSDDLTSRFSEFLKVTFGQEHYEENLKFITDAIGKDIRKYFLKDFYKDHLKTYKKRPIYWLFSSPKGSFNALIYMHRYRPDTISVILNDYLREFRTKLQNAQENLEQLSISADATKTEKTKALKQIEKLKKTIIELDTYENETLYPLATQNIEIDLDDGVKVNYKKFGKALKKVPGLS